MMFGPGARFMQLILPLICIVHVSVGGSRQSPSELEAGF